MQAIDAMSAGASEEARLQMWLGAGLNEGTLAARLQAVQCNAQLCAMWYDRCTLVSWPSLGRNFTSGSCSTTYGT